jgi:phage shock protein PspC (stress-responsive transcriptional regulator)
MKAAITVELDGATFVLDEGAYQALRSYLDRGAARLRNHPDRAEVIAGLERSIGAELARGPGAQGMSLDHAEMLAALKEVGRVDGPELGEPGASPAAAPAGAGFGTGFAAGFGAGPGPGPGPGRAPASGPGANVGARAGADRGPGRGPGSGPDPGRTATGARPRTRRLYRLREGQHIAGVCAGLAAFSEVDVGIIRFLFLLGALFSGGMLLLVYVVLMFVMPVARTEAEVAEARGGLPAS